MSDALGTPGPPPAPAPAELRPPLISVEASYGAGGPEVAHGLAERLGVALLGPPLTKEEIFARSSAVSRALAAEARGRAPVGRLAAALHLLTPAGPTLPPPNPRMADAELRTRGAAELEEFIAAGGGVIFERGAAVLLGKGRCFQVFLGGPEESRLRRVVETEQITLQAAREHMRLIDGTRRMFSQRLFKLDPDDPPLFHLMLDSSALPLETVVELILTAVARFSPDEPTSLRRIQAPGRSEAT